MVTATPPLVNYNDGRRASTISECTDPESGIRWVLTTSMDLDLESVFECIEHSADNGKLVRNYLAMPGTVRAAFDAVAATSVTLLLNL
jgi:hypothetical protein